MTIVTNPNLAKTFRPPMMESRCWLDGKTFPENRPLLNVSQAAPVAPPPAPLRKAIAEIVLNDADAHLYGPVLGLPELRSEIAEQWGQSYGGNIAPTQVAITSGCNQAFTAAVSSLAGPGDEVILPTPWYFNHKMHLDMSGISAIPLPASASLLPDPADAQALITPRTRAIVLVTPNNPTGTEYPVPLVRQFYDLAKDHGLALIIDETYRDFDARTGPPHDLFTDPNWDQTLIQLYSFSKAFRMTGHRVGSIATSAARLDQIEKYLDTVSICPNQISQRAALWGLQNLGAWLAEERDEILTRRAALQNGFGQASGWQLLGLGAYFAYVRHSFDMTSDRLAPLLVEKTGILMLPGTMFNPPNTPSAQHEMRIAFANVDQGGIADLISRLGNLDL